MLGPAWSRPGVPGAAGAVSRSSFRAHGVGAARPRGLLPPGRPAAERGRAAHRAGRRRALRAAAAAHLSPAGQPQVATALDMLTCLERHLEDRRHQLLVTARHLTGARVLTARLYGVGPVTALAMTAWLGEAGRFSSSRKAATRHEREGHTQRRVTRGTRQRCGRDGTARRPDRTALRRVRRRGRRQHQWAHDDVQLRARRKCCRNSSGHGPQQSTSSQFRSTFSGRRTAPGTQPP